MIYVRLELAPAFSSPAIAGEAKPSEADDQIVQLDDLGTAGRRARTTEKI
jgi:hypothetical protein